MSRIKVLEKEIDQLNMENTLLWTTNMNIKPSELQTKYEQLFEENESNSKMLQKLIKSAQNF